MQVTETSAASNAEQLAHGRTAVERWLTWTGLLPLPVFMLLHLGRELSLAFADDVSDVLRPPPTMFSRLTGLLLVWLPLGIHALLAGWLLLARRTLTPLSQDVPPMARLTSRVTSWLALAFVVHHGQTFAIEVWRGRAAGEDAGFRLLSLLASSSHGVPLSSAAYLVGLGCSVTHAALGVHRGLLAEGWLATVERRQRSARLCAAIGALLFAIGSLAVIRVASGVFLR
jgi:hypothetical protein